MGGYTVYGNLVLRGGCVFNSKNGNFDTEINIRNNKGHGGSILFNPPSGSTVTYYKPWGLNGYSDTTYISGSQVVLTIPLDFSTTMPYGNDYTIGVGGSYGFTYTLNYDGYKSGSTTMYSWTFSSEHSLNRPSSLNSTATTYLINTTKSYDYSTTGYKIY